MRHDLEKAERKGRLPLAAAAMALAHRVDPTFVLSYALARGVLASGLFVTAAMAVGMIATIGGTALIAAFARERLVHLLARSESWRHRAGMALEVGGAALVILLGVSTLLGSTRT